MSYSVDKQPPKKILIKFGKLNQFCCSHPDCLKLPHAEKQSEKVDLKSWADQNELPGGTGAEQLSLLCCLQKVLWVLEFSHCSPKPPLASHTTHTHPTSDDRCSHSRQGTKWLWIFSYGVYAPQIESRDSKESYPKQPGWLVSVCVRGCVISFVVTHFYYDHDHLSVFILVHF